MGRVVLGWRYARQSFSIVRRDGALTGLAAIGIALACGLATGPLALAVWAFHGEKEVLGWVAAAVTCFAVYIGLTVSGVAIASAAVEVLAGRDASVTASLGLAKARLRPILGWCMTGTLVAAALLVVRKKGGRSGEFLAQVGGETWSLVTFLAIPIIAFEALDPVSTLKRSATLFRERWGEQMVGTGSISLVFFLLSLPPIAVVVSGVVALAEGAPLALGIVLGIVGGVGLIAVALAGRASSATFAAILYGYATSGEIPEGIPLDQLKNLGRPVVTTA